MAVINGDEFDNSLVGTDFDDYIYAGLGNDTLTSTKGYDRLYGGDGQDTLTIDCVDSEGTGNNYGGNGDDIIVTNFGGLTGTSSRPEHGYGYGGAGNDYLTGDASHFGDSGNDTIDALGSWASGGEGDDLITLHATTTLFAFHGDEGNDTLIGDAGSNKLDLGTGNDLAYGGKGRDLIIGGSGNDTIYGGNGNDTLVSYQGEGVDRLRGGSGADRFVFSGADYMGTGSKKDWILDFESGVDKLELYVFGVDLQFIGNADFTNVAGEVRFDSASKVVQLDADGDGVADGSVKVFTTTFDAGDLIL